jgi:hypothetical protein
MFTVYSYGGGFENWPEKREINISKCDSSVVRDGVIIELGTVKELCESMQRFIPKSREERTISFV